MTGGSPEATGTPQFPGSWSEVASVELASAAPQEGAGHSDGGDATEIAEVPVAEPGTIDGTRFAHASEAEMARILDFYEVRWEYEPTTFPILWNLDGEVVESFAPDFYLPELELFLEMTTLKQRLVRKKNRKLRRLKELYPGIRIKLFYARDFRAMMLKYGRLALAEALSGTPGQVVSERASERALERAAERGSIEPVAPVAQVEPVEPVDTSALIGDETPIHDSSTIAPALVGASPRSRNRRRRRRQLVAIEAGADQETGA
ncbi:MAG: hypothetical protein ABIZ52_05230 [Candidatus Limnocylindrales bacterium]